MTRINLSEQRKVKLLFGLLLIPVAALSYWMLRFSSEWMALLIFSSAISAVLLFWNRRLEFDDENIYLIKSFILPISRKKFPRKKSIRVALSKQITRSQNGNHHSEQTYYPVKIHGLGKETFFSSKSFLNSRKVAEALATALNLPLNDRSHDNNTTRANKSLNTPLYQQWRNADLVHSRPDTEKGSVFNIERAANTTRITYPGLGRDMIFVCITTALVVIASSLFSWIFWQYPLVVAGYYLFLLLMLLREYLKAGLNFIVINSERIRYKSGRYPRYYTIAMDEVEELFDDHCGGFILQGDNRSLSLPWSCNEQETRRLWKILQYEIARVTKDKP